VDGLFITYIVTRISLQAVVEECNRMALEEESYGRARYLKSRIAQLDLDFANGVISEEEYARMGSQILEELKGFSSQGAQEFGGL
jgi:hypothetical protein